MPDEDDEGECVIAPDFSLKFSLWSVIMDRPDGSGAELELVVLPASDTTQLLVEPSSPYNHCCLFVPTDKMRELIALLTEAMDWYDAGCCDESEYTGPASKKPERA